MKNNTPVIILLFVIIVAVTLFGFNNIQNSANDRDLNRIKENIKEGIIECYAIEGHYPDSIEYLKNNYGLYLNDDSYQIHFRYLGSNIMPEYAVFLKGDR